MFDLFEQVNSTLGGLLVPHVNCISVALAGGEVDSRLPRTPRRHGTSRTRTVYSNKGDILCFLVGDSVVALRDFVSTGDVKHALLAEQHLALLQSIVEDGLGVYYADGSDRTGYTLTHETTLANRRAKAAQAEE